MKFIEVKDVDGDLMILNLEYLVAFREYDEITEVMMRDEKVEIDMPYNSFKKLLLSKFGLPL